VTVGGPRHVAEIASYHAHVYFKAGDEYAAAKALRGEIGERFSVRLGTVRNKPVGPHPQPMFQIAFAPELFHSLVPWLMLNHRGLSVLIHPSTTTPRLDHLEHALWLGTRLPLSAEGLPEHEPVAEVAGEPNTASSQAP
jgi:DOPA 4,5-dioxygenase